MSIAFIFPGQGSQAVGMGAELAKAYAPARAVFAEVDEALGQSLSTLIWVGPEDQLTLTENAQPALMAVSLAVIRVLEAEKGLSLKESVTFVAGHSLGERACQGGKRGRGLRRCQRQCPWPGGDQRHADGDRAGRRARPEIRRSPRRAASG